MSLWSWMFGKRVPSFDEARELLKEAERLVERDQLAAMSFMSSKRFKRIPSEIVGPGGPLHGRLLAILFKLKGKVAAADSPPAKVGRNWQNLPRSP